MMKTFNYTPYNSQFELCPVKLLTGKLYYEGCEKPLYILGNPTGDWGDSLAIVEMKKDRWPMPNRLELRYATKDTGKCYAIDTPLDVERAEELWEAQEEEYPDAPFIHYVVGTAPHGGVAIWLRGDDRSVLLHWFQAPEVSLTKDEQQFLKRAEIENEVEFITSEQLQKDMQQFEYRYEVLEECFEDYEWKLYDEEDLYFDDIDIDSVEDKRTDGTFQYLENDSLMKYHTAGKPLRISVRWHEGRSDYFAHYWINNFGITHFLDTFFKVTGEKRVTIMLRLDIRNNWFALALKGESPQFRPLPIPSNAYQVIVFEDDEECFRSRNFHQEPGDWNWLKSDPVTKEE